MPYSSSPDFPLSQLNEDQLCDLAQMPITSAEFIYEIYCEVVRRNLSRAPELIIKLRLAFVQSRQRELSLELSALDRVAIGEPELVQNQTLDELARQMRSGNYNPLLRKLIELLITPTDRGQFRQEELFPKSINRRTFGEVCRILVERSIERRSEFLPIQSEAFRLAEEAASYCDQLNDVIVLGSPPKLEIQISEVSKKSLKHPSQKITPKTWEQTVKHIRHARIHPDANNIQFQNGANDWADMSPLKMLGYSVSSKDGLSDREREEFLIDFCESAELPSSLPIGYTDPWGKPYTKLRIHRTARHLGFVKRNFEKQDPLKFSNAISSWRRDFDFLKYRYEKFLSGNEWVNAGKGK